MRGGHCCYGNMREGGHYCYGNERVNTVLWQWEGGHCCYGNERVNTVAMVTWRVDTVAMVMGGRVDATAMSFSSCW